MDDYNHWTVIIGSVIIWITAVIGLIDRVIIWMMAVICFIGRVIM